MFTARQTTHLHQIAQNHIPMTLQHRKGDEQHKFVAIVIRPQHFPQPEDVIERELALERYEDPSAKHRQSRHERHRSAWNIPETEEEVKSVRFLCGQSVSDRAAMSSETVERTKMSI